MTTRPTPTRRQLALAAPFALVLVTSACGGNTATSTPAASTTSGASATTAPAAGGTALKAVVGEADAFTIDLTDASGAPVTTLKAGSYTVQVKDASKIHNFHLKGPGVDQKTSVPDIGDTTWNVNLTAGSYTYKCDPHSGTMSGSFTVT